MYSEETNLAKYSKCFRQIEAFASELLNILVELFQHYW